MTELDGQGLTLNLKKYPEITKNSADLASWNRYTDMISNFVGAQQSYGFKSHQDLIISKLMREHRYSELSKFLTKMRKFNRFQ